MAGHQTRPDRFVPDWILGAVVRLCPVPVLWTWGRAHAGDWPGVVPEIIAAAEYWAIPVMDAELVAQICVWGCQLIAVLLVFGFLTRLAGLALLAGCSAYLSWILPEAWPSVIVFAAMAFYLFARGGGALSVDGAIAATVK